MDHRPFLVEVRLSTPLILMPDTTLTLDGLLYGAILERTGDMDAAKTDIPLSRTGAIWHGSSLFMIGGIREGRFFKSDLNPVSGDLEPYAGRIMRKGGPNMPRLDERPMFDANRVFWFGHGDMAAVEGLLRSINGIGKKHNHGYGAISEIHLREISVDRSVALPDGTPARPIPNATWKRLAGVRDGQLDMTTFFPAYPDRENSALCQMPLTRHMQQAHIDHIESGFVAPDLPGETDVGRQRFVSGRDFFYEHLGRALYAAHGSGLNPPKGTQCEACGSTAGIGTVGSGYTTLCERCATVAGGYKGITRPGRMGAGWMGIVRPGEAVLATSVEYSKRDRPFRDHPGVDLRMGKRALFEMRRSMIDAPPEPPFLFFEADRSSIPYIQGLTVTWSLDRSRWCGKGPRIVNIAAIRAFVDAWRGSDVAATDVFKAGMMRLTRDFGFSNGIRQKSADDLAEMTKKNPALEEILPLIPRADEPTFDEALRFVRSEGQL